MIVDDFIFIGILGGSFGTNGAVNLTSWSSYPERFEDMKSFFLTKEKAVPKTLDIERLEITNKRIVVKFKGVNSIEAANLLNGYRVTIPKSERFELPEGQYYIDDLLTCQAFTVEGELLGNLTDVWEMGPNEIYVVDYQGQELLIPVVDEFIKKIDIDAKRITVQLIDGMLPGEETEDENQQDED
jgi:16S rRNA processing protein RimM